MKVKSVSKDKRVMNFNDFLKLKKEEPYTTYRFRSKGINFRFLYNGSSWSLQPDIDLEWTEEEMDDYIEKNDCIKDHEYGKAFIVADDIHNNFMSTYKNIPIYANKQIDKAKKNGYIKTILGNVRHLPDLLYIPRKMEGSQAKDYSHLESICTNTEILSIEAFMMHIAMKNIYDHFKKCNMKSKLIMMIHDSVGVKIHKDEVEQVKKICHYYLENFGINLNGISIESECKDIGKYWGV